jgi:hypothetical protein
MMTDETCSANEPMFDWYRIVSATAALEQGDLLNDFPIVIPSVSVLERLPDGPVVDLEIEVPAAVEYFNVVVMTQSCDFLKLGDEGEVILCPRFSYKGLTDEEPNRWGKKSWKPLVSGRVIGSHIIDKCDIEDFEFDYQVIDLRRIFSVPFSVVKQVAINQGDRVRLLPPYREHLAQAFARQFMRVGLPQELPPEYPYPVGSSLSVF